MTMKPTIMETEANRPFGPDAVSEEGRNERQDVLQKE